MEHTLGKVTNSTSDRAYRYNAVHRGRRDAAANVDVARRGERERPTSLTALLTRAATHWKGTFYICMWPTITSLLENNVNASFICTVFDTVSLVARAFRIGRLAVSLQASNRSRRQCLSGCAWQGVQRAGRSCLRVGQELRHRASCGCPAAMLAPPFCRGSNGASRMRTPARNSCEGNDESHQRRRAEVVLMSPTQELLSSTMQSAFVYRSSENLTSSLKLATNHNHWIRFNTFVRLHRLHFKSYVSHWFTCPQGTDTNPPLGLSSEGLSLLPLFFWLKKRNLV